MESVSLGERLWAVLRETRWETEASGSLRGRNMGSGREADREREINRGSRVMAEGERGTSGLRKACGLGGLH